MNLILPFDVEVRGQASSVFTREQIDRRLADLAGRPDEEARQEVRFLEALRARTFAQTADPR